MRGTTMLKSVGISSAKRRKNPLRSLQHNLRGGSTAKSRKRTLPLLERSHQPPYKRRPADDIRREKSLCS